MASKITYFVAALCILHYAHAANLRKRSIIDDVKQKVQEAVDQAESKFNEVSENISALISSTLQDVQTKAAEVIGEIQSAVATAQQIGRNIEPCVSGQEAATRRVVDETGQDLQTCAQTAISPLNTTIADLLNLNAQALQLPALAASNIGTGLARGVLIISSLTEDLAQLASQFQQVPSQLAACAADEVTKATKELSQILETVTACVLNGLTPA